MKKTVIILSILALITGSCGNKKVPFDLSTLSPEWTEMTYVDDRNVGVCNGADVLIIDGNKFTRRSVDAGREWVYEILESHKAGDTVVLNVEPTGRKEKYDFKFIWLDKDKGIAQWSFDEERDTTIFVPNDKLSEFPKVNCRQPLLSDDAPYDDAETKSINVETRSKKPEDLVRSDETIFEKEFGDLNNDGKKDCVIITKQTKKEFTSVKNQFDEKVDRNRRGILIAFKEGEFYNTVLKIPDCFSSENEDGGVYFAPELSVEIKRGNLVVHYGHGRYGWWQYIFRYRNNDFELIGYDSSEDRGPITEKMTSINFLTKKEQTLTNKNPDADPDADNGKEVFEEIWQNIVIDKLLKLTDIKDFDEFSIFDCYSK